MEKFEENKNLSETRIYDVLKVKNPKEFHLKAAARNIIKALDQVETARRDLLSTPFSKNKRANRAIVNEISKQLYNVSWNLLSLGEAAQKLLAIKQNGGIVTDNALSQLLDELQNGSEEII